MTIEFTAEELNELDNTSYDSLIEEALNPKPLQEEKA